MESEKEPLIHKKTAQIEKDIKIRLSHFLIIPMIVLFYLPAEIMVYIVNEWTQHTVKAEHFLNTTLGAKSSPCEDRNKTDDTSAQYRHVERVTSQWILYNKLAEMIPLILVNMILPSYSDTYGRKFVFIIAMSGLFAKDILITLAIYYDLPYFTVVFAYGVEGLTGASTAISSMAFAFIADLTVTDRNRVLGVVAIEMVFLLAGLCPGFISGYIIQSPYIGFKWSVIVCTCVMSSALVIAIFFLPETLPKGRRTSPRPILRTIKRTFDFYTSHDFKGKRVFYLLLLLAYSLSCIAGNNRSTMETLYFLDQPFCWNAIYFGYFTLVRQFAKAIFGSLSLPLLQLCLTNEAILIFSASSTLVSYILEGLATTVLVVYISAVIGSLSFLNVPLIKGLVSAMTAGDKQGSLFASFSVISEVSSLVSYLSSNLAYNATVSVMNGFVFLVMAGFSALQVILLIIFWCKRNTSKVNDIESVNR